MTSSDRDSKSNENPLISGPITAASDAAYNLITSLNVFWFLLAALFISIVLTTRIPDPEQRQPVGLFRTTALKIGRTPYDLQWRHASQPLSTSRLAGVRQAVSQNGDWLARLDVVHRQVNERIRYAEDRELYGKLDYWASPDETALRQAGDCEDSAILKMALLASAGFPKEKMYLTIGRDLVSRNAHAILTVDLDGELYVLDQLSPNLVGMAQYNDFRPFVTISDGNFWVHSAPQF